MIKLNLSLTALLLILLPCSVYALQEKSYHCMIDGDEHKLDINKSGEVFWDGKQVWVTSTNGVRMRQIPSKATERDGHLYFLKIFGESQYSFKLTIKTGFVKARAPGKENLIGFCDDVSPNTKNPSALVSSSQSR
jgi:hypothetical protein